MEPAEIERHASTIDARGYTIVDGVVDDELRTALLDTIARAMDDHGVTYGANNFLGGRTRRLFNLLSRDPIFARVPVLDTVLPLVERLLDDQCLLSSLTAIEMNPGETDQPLHADDGSIPLPRPHQPLGCTAIIALTDFTEANGATHVVEGSHTFDRKPGKAERAATVRAVASAGSALVYHGSTWHAGGANRSDGPRIAIVVNYCAGFVRQEENQLLGVPREMVVGFSQRLQELCGYGTYRGLIGHVDERNPRTLVDPQASTEMVWEKLGG